MVPRARCDGAEAEAPIVPEGALVESAPAPVDVPKVGQTGGGMTEASPADAVTAQTSEPELPASSAIGGSAPEGALVTEEVPSAPIGLMLTGCGSQPLGWG